MRGLAWFVPLAVVLPWALLTVSCGSSGSLDDDSSLRFTCEAGTCGSDGSATDGATSDGGVSDGGQGDGPGPVSVCGDRRVEGAEACDDGNRNGADGCSSACAVEDGFVCRQVPSVCERCGDAVLDSLEGCDDGNRTEADGCSPTCELEDGYVCAAPGLPCEPCGDAVVDALEGCDDGNRTAGDGCSAACQVEAGFSCAFGACVAAECGDGVRAGTETCDDGNRLSGDGCSYLCKVEPGYLCVTDGVACRAAVCGDAAVEADEQCDDGDAAGGDGCDAACQLEPGYACPMPGSDCQATTCGDGTREGTEACDDGDASGGDGCDANCQLEAGYACPTPGSMCVLTTCGDGAREGSEACDDGNVVATDGCDASCNVEAFYHCEGQGPGSCASIPGYVAIAEFPAPMAQPQAVHYDPDTRSFVAYGYNASQGLAEFCLDGTAVSGGGRTRYGIGDRMDGATYDPFTDRYLFVQQTKTMTEIDRATNMVLRTHTLSEVGLPGGIVVGDDGRIYVSDHFQEAFDVYVRDGDALQYVESLAAPTDGPYLDNAFSIPGEGLIGAYNLPPGSSGGDPEVVSFYRLDGTLEGRSEIPGVLFASGRTFPARADGGEAAPDGGYFLVCSEYLRNGGMDNGICQLFARRCANHAECANRIPNTACKLEEAIPYCYSPALARDDQYRVDVNSSNNLLDVSENDIVSDAVCKGETVALVSATTGSEGGTIALDVDGVSLRYAPPAGFCGAAETFEYTTNLGGVQDTARVTVVVACICGDGQLQTYEECDDGGTAPGDGCDANCRRENSCGDGTVGPGEECDDGNTAPNDGCSPNCTKESVLF